MPRALSTALATLFASGEIFPVIFVQLNFVSGPVNVWSGVGSITWNSTTWSGLGSLGDISAIEESSQIEAKGVVLTCSGIDSTLLSDLLSEVRQGLAAQIFIGSFTDATRTVLVSDPIAAWTGRVDQPSISVGETTSTISISCEDRLSEMNTPVDRRYTNDDQQIDHPGDMGYEFVCGLQNVFVSWGRIPYGQ